MRCKNHAYAIGLILAIAGCGDNINGGTARDVGLVVKTSVAGQTIVAGTRVDARCEVEDASGEPALDAQGNTLTASAAFEILYEDQDAFAKDGAGQVIAARAGTATVRCTAPDLDLVDPKITQIEIVAGPAARVITQITNPVVTAGQPVGVTCLAFDAFNNAVAQFDQSLALSPAGAGVTTTSSTVAATLAGNYQVACVVAGAGDVTGDNLVVVPDLPQSLAAAIAPEHTTYTIDDQVTLIAEARDRYGNRVDDVALAYGASPTVPSPSAAQFRFNTDGTFALSATVTSPTDGDLALSASQTVFVNSVGPTIQCLRIDAPVQESEAYMMQSAEGLRTVPVHVNATFNVQSVTIADRPATLNPSTGNYEASVSIGFGMNFLDVVATDQFGKQNSTTCFVLEADTFAAEGQAVPGALGMRLGATAISDASGGLNSINDILQTILGSAELRNKVDQGLTTANPIHNGSCGLGLEPTVTYTAHTLQWGTPSTSLALVPGGLRAQITLPSVQLKVSACSAVPGCIGGSDITVTSDPISATVTFGLALQNGKLHASVQGDPTVVVATPTLSGTGFCGFVVNLLQGLFVGDIANQVHGALVTFIGTSVAPLLDQLVSSLDISTLATSFSVPRLDGSGNVQLQFGLQFSSLNITDARALLSIGTAFTPAVAGQVRPSLGVPRRAADPLLDPPTSSQVGLSLYEGVLNQVLHGLWRGGFFTATLPIGGATGGTATIDALLPPVAAVVSNRTRLMLGGIKATITIPGVIDTPLQILFGGRADVSVSLVGDALHFGNLSLTDVFASFQASLSQAQRAALETLLAQVLQSVLVNALNAGLPAFPIPTFALPASAADFGLPAGAKLGVTNPQLSSTLSHFVLTGGFGVRQ